MPQMMRIVMVLLLACLSAAVPVAAAQERNGGSPQSTMQKRGARPAPPSLFSEASQDAAAGLAAKDKTAGEASADPEEMQYTRAYWEYRRGMLDHNKRVFAWQHVSTIIIFCVVIFLVLVGVLFSWLQFRAAAYKGESEALDASMAGVKITSSTLGVVILVLSMCFFYLYLRYVYPITTDAPVQPAAAVPPAAAVQPSATIPGAPVPTAAPVAPSSGVQGKSAGH